MKTLATLALLSTMLATLALAQTRHISLVKGSPTNYGPYGFDISWVDNSTQKYYLADRTNNAIDLVDAATDTFLGFIGKGQYSGSRPCPDHPKDLRHCSGPNGVVTDGLGHVWAGNGAGDIIEASATQPGTTVIRKIPIGGKFRIDEVAYDPIDGILMASSDGDSPPFLTFISTTDGSVLGHYKYPLEQDGRSNRAESKDYPQSGRHRRGLVRSQVQQLLLRAHHGGSNGVGHGPGRSGGRGQRSYRRVCCRHSFRGSRGSLSCCQCEERAHLRSSLWEGHLRCSADQVNRAGAARWAI